jgi:hypothetical protein
LEPVLGEGEASLNYFAGVNAGVTSILARSPMCRISYVMDVTSRSRGVYVLLDRSARSV